MPLYEVVILESPTEKEKKEGAVERLVFGPKPVVALTAKAAILEVTKTGELTFDNNRVEIIARPFESE